MELQSDVVHQVPRNAATVVLLRDGSNGLEVFLVKRHGLSDVLGGAYVFPGGKLDEADCELNPTVHLDHAPQALHAALGEPLTDLRTACGLYVAAVRETFEESGVLLAHGSPALNPQASFHDQVSAHQLRLYASRLVPWAHWITPTMPSVTQKRFDTRFFIATMPEGQNAGHDNYETTASAWLQPHQAIAQYWNREIELAPPQIMCLAHLSRHRDVHSVTQEALGKTPAVVMPEAFDQDGERMICYPGDPQHSLQTPAMPGPTRLFWRNKRFEPEGGLDALLG